jgi:Mg2+/Co2+ transporter CorB
MIPRTEIIAVEADLPLTEIIPLVTESTYTKFPVYDDDMDQILGIVHVKDLLRRMLNLAGRTTPPVLSARGHHVPRRSGLRLAAPVPRQLPAYRHRADEYGGTAGLSPWKTCWNRGRGQRPLDLHPRYQRLPDGSS